MYLVFTTNWGHKKKNYLQIRNNNNNVHNVHTIKICSMYKLYNKTIGIQKVVSRVAATCRLARHCLYFNPLRL